MNGHAESPAQRVAIAQALRPAGAARVALVLAVLALSGLLTACSPTAAAPPETIATPAAPPTWTVIGIDRSGSYNFLSTGRDLALRAIESAAPRDVVIVRWIAANSFRSAEFVLRYAAPEIQLPDCSHNPFDSTCRRARLVEESKLRGAQEEAKSRLLNLTAEKAEKTDIVGFLVAAGQQLEAAPPEAKRVVWLVTDMLDNVRLPVEPDLRGVEVLVRALENEDAVKALALRNYWQERLVGLGAHAVRFENVEEVLR